MSTVLVVDDKTLFREPIVAALRQEGYETMCAGCGREAIQITNKKCPDLILLDVAMSGMDGLACLAALRADTKTKDVPVIVLTAISERDVVGRAAGLGIQDYLLKSQFALDELLSKIRGQIGPAKRDRARSSSESTTSDHAPAETISVSAEASASPRPIDQANVLKRIRRQLKLRAVPPVLHHVMTLTHSKSSSLDEIAQAIRQDQSLALRLMRVANSSYYASDKPVENPMEAVQRIGLSEVQNIIVTMLAMDRFGQSTPGGLVPQRFWEHSLASANLACMIAEAIDSNDGDQLFLAALLHDIGRMILAEVFPREYNWVLTTSCDRRINLVDVESQVFNMSHVDVTTELLQEWKFPEYIIDAVSSHEHEIENIKLKTRSGRAPIVLAFANRLAHALALGDSGNATIMPFRNHLKALDLDDECISEITERAIEKTKGLELLYASRGDEQLLQPLASELAQQADDEIRMAVIGDDRQFSPVSLFCEQLGWLDGVAPCLAAMCVANEHEVSRCCERIFELENTIETRFGILIVLEDGSAQPSPHLLEDRPCITVELPIRYTDFVSAVTQLWSRLSPSCKSHNVRHYG